MASVFHRDAALGHRMKITECSPHQLAQEIHVCKGRCFTEAVQRCSWLSAGSRLLNAAHLESSAVHTNEQHGTSAWKFSPCCFDYLAGTPEGAARCTPPDTLNHPSHEKYRCCQCNLQEVMESWPGQLSSECKHCWRYWMCWPPPIPFSSSRAQAQSCSTWALSLHAAEDTFPTVLARNAKSAHETKCTCSVAPFSKQRSGEDACAPDDHTNTSGTR
jgi:hypothetical protein